MILQKRRKCRLVVLQRLDGAVHRRRKGAVARREESEAREVLEGLECGGVSTSGSVASCTSACRAVARVTITAACPVPPTAGAVASRGVELGILEKVDHGCGVGPLKRGGEVAGWY